MHSREGIVKMFIQVGVWKRHTGPNFWNNLWNWWIWTSANLAFRSVSAARNLSILECPIIYITFCYSSSSSVQRYGGENMPCTLRFYRRESTFHLQKKFNLVLWCFDYSNFFSLDSCDIHLEYFHINPSFWFVEWAFSRFPMLSGKEGIYF